MSTVLRNQSELVHGYIKQSYSNHIPFEIINIIISFYNLVHHWWIKDEELTNFLDGTPGKTVKFEPFVCKEITFQCKINLIEGSLSNDVHIEYCLSYTNTDHKIKNMLYFGELSCPTTKSKRYFITNRSSVSWLRSTLKSEDCKQFDALCFTCFLDIAHIIYGSKIKTPKINYFRDNMVISKHVEYKWKICGKALDEIKSYKDFKSDGWIIGDGIDSEVFGEWNMWTLNLFHMEKLKISPRILFIPYGVDAFMIGIKIKNSFNDTIIDDQCKFQASYEGSVFIGFDSIDICTIDELYLEVNMEIKGLYNELEQMIDEEKWNEYGIVP